MIHLGIRPKGLKWISDSKISQLYENGGSTVYWGLWTTGI